MSRSVDLFIQSPKPIEDVAAEVGRLTGISLTPGSVPGTWALEHGSVRAELHAHPYVDDGDLAFERYRYALSTRTSDGARAADSAEANLLRMVSEALHKARVGCLLVHDLQFRDGGRPAGPVAAHDPGQVTDAAPVAAPAAEPPGPAPTEAP